MTREEAIQVLEEEAEYLYQDDRPYNREAFDMAIEALSEGNIARDIATILENEQDMRVILNLVRCKDCRHGWYDDDIEYYTCRHPKGLNEELYGVDFCSYGERRENANTD